MRAPLIRRPGAERCSERGVTIALVALAMVAIIGMAMIAIDLVTLFLAREEAQRAADAAALAAARIISVSGITGTGTPGLQTAYWEAICGPAASGTGGIATLAALAAAGENAVGGSSANNVKVTYSTYGSSGGSSDDCSARSAAFAVNPVVTVTVQRTGLPTFFSRYWGYGGGQSVTATATAEAFNPSASDVNNNGGTTGIVTPVQPRCVKPWMIPNTDPMHPSNCTNNGGFNSCYNFVSVGTGFFGGGNDDGQIVNPGISLGGAGTTGVIGETFTLFADCKNTTSPCGNPDNPLQANVNNSFLYNGSPPPMTPNLEYLPGLIQSSAIAVPSCGNSGTGGNAIYETAVSGCDQSTVYQCGVPASFGGGQPNEVDLTENPGGSNGDTANGMACTLTGQANPSLVGQGDTAQDFLDTSAYPFKITAGSSNPTAIASGTQISGSGSIVSLPIYDVSGFGNGRLFFGFGGGGTYAPVTIVGFLQVFVNYIDQYGNLNVTVLNVAGCGNGAGGNVSSNPVSGSSPVPIRLITPP